MPDEPRARLPALYLAFTVFTVLACVALSVLVVVLLQQNRRLKQATTEASETVGSTGLVIGERPAALEVVAARPESGARALEFTDGRRGTLILVTSAACEICAHSLPYFSALAEAWSEKGLVAADIQIDAASMESLAHEGSGALPAVAVRNAAQTWLRRVPMVPAVLIFDAEGALVKSYYGELSPRQQGELGDVLGRILGP